MSDELTDEASSEVPFEYDQSVVGVEVEVGSVTITREMIERYCRVVGEQSPLFTDDAAASSGPYGEVVAPPAMLQTVNLGRGPDAGVKFGNTTFAAGQRLEFLAPVRVGDTITANAQVKEVYQKTGRSGSMIFVVNRVTFRNQRDEAVTAVEQSMVHREV